MNHSHHVATIHTPQPGVNIAMLLHAIEGQYPGCYIKSPKRIEIWAPSPASVMILNADIDIDMDADDDDIDMDIAEEIGTFARVMNGVRK